MHGGPGIAILLPGEGTHYDPCPHKFGSFTQLVSNHAENAQGSVLGSGTSNWGSSGVEKVGAD